MHWNRARVMQMLRVFAVQASNGQTAGPCCAQSTLRAHAVPSTVAALQLAAAAARPPVLSPGRLQALQLHSLLRRLDCTGAREVRRGLHLCTPPERCPPLRVVCTEARSRIWPSGTPATSPDSVSWSTANRLQCQTHNPRTHKDCHVRVTNAACQEA